jgi:2-amino-4-hydroxy-6-hydroxymethyldihydropteridine diphosphokinase
MLMNTNRAYIEIGGNMGDKLQLISKAKEMLENTRCSIVAESSVYETEPWGFIDSQNFYNQVVEVVTQCTAHELLSHLQDIENRLGRVRGKQQYMSRTMDLDILFYNNEIINTEQLEVPHPRLHLRKFVLVPLNEVAQNHKHPIIKKTISQLLEQNQDTLECVRVKTL